MEQSRHCFSVGDRVENVKRHEAGTVLEADALYYCVRWEEDGYHGIYDQGDPLNVLVERANDKEAA